MQYVSRIDWICSTLWAAKCLTYCGWKKILHHFVQYYIIMCIPVGDFSQFQEYHSIDWDWLWQKYSSIDWIGCKREQLYKTWKINSISLPSNKQWWIVQFFLTPRYLAAGDPRKMKTCQAALRTSSMAFRSWAAVPPFISLDLQVWWE